MKLGATQYTLALDGVGWLEAAARLGLDGAEPYIGAMTDPLMQAPAAELSGVVRQAMRLNVAIPSVAIGVFNTDASLVTDGGFTRAVDIVRRGIELTAGLGGQTMLLCAFLVSHPDNERKRQNLLRVLHAVESLAGERNIVIALETPNPAGELLQMVDAAGSTHVRVYYDVGNALAMRQDPVAELDILGERIAAIHIKDSTLGQLGSRHLGDGALDLQAVMRAIQARRYTGWLMLETPGGDPARLVEELALVRSGFSSESVAV